MYAQPNWLSRRMDRCFWLSRGPGGVAIDVALKGHERVSNGSASNGKFTIAGGRAGRIDEVVKSIDNLTGLGNGGKICSNPLPKVAGSPLRHAAIASCANQKTGPTCQIECVHRFDRCSRSDEGRGGSKHDLAEHDYTPRTTPPFFRPETQRPRSSGKVPLWSWSGVGGHRSCDEADHHDHHSYCLCRKEHDGMEGSIRTNAGSCRATLRSANTAPRDMTRPMLANNR
jgi:hypothetical protein